VILRLDRPPPPAAVKGDCTRPYGTRLTATALLTNIGMRVSPNTT
jgi:hypothetical protein